jgi:hypothetical protein
MNIHKNIYMHICVYKKKVHIHIHMYIYIYIGNTNKEKEISPSFINEVNRENNTNPQLPDFYLKFLHLLEVHHPDLLFVNFKSFPPPNSPGEGGGGGGDYPPTPPIIPCSNSPSHIPMNMGPSILSIAPTNLRTTPKSNVIHMATDVIDYFLSITSAQNGNDDSANYSKQLINDSTCKVIFTLFTPLFLSSQESGVNLIEECVKTILHW